jgi:hypothetical protein
LQLADIHTRPSLPKTIYLNGMMKAAEVFQVAEPLVLSQIRSGISSTDYTDGRSSRGKSTTWAR